MEPGTRAAINVARYLHLVTAMHAKPTPLSYVRRMRNGLPCLAPITAASSAIMYREEPASAGIVVMQWGDQWAELALDYSDDERIHVVWTRFVSRCRERAKIATLPLAAAE
jgi:hypothetical protein